MTRVAASQRSTTTPTTTSRVVLLASGRKVPKPNVGPRYQIRVPSASAPNSVAAQRGGSGR